MPTVPRTKQANSTAKWNVGQLLTVFALMVNSFVIFCGVAHFGANLGLHQLESHQSNFKSGWKVGETNKESGVTREQLHTVFQAVENQLFSSSGGSGANSNQLRALSPTNTGSSMGFTQHFRNLYRYQTPNLPFLRDTKSEAEECGQGPAYSKFFQQYPNKRSRMEEDKTIYSTFFEDVNTTGFKYLELGGFDGVNESNSRFFDVCLGWEGILVEPSLTYQQMVANRPNAHRLSFAASCNQQEADQGKTVGFYATEWSNSAQSDTANAFMSDKEAGKPIQVPCGPLTPVIQDLLGGHIHFMSLDVEGAEPLVLKHGMDFNKVFIEVLIVENWNAFCNEECETRDQARKFLTEEANYALFPGLVRLSDLYVHKKSKFLSKVPSGAKRLDKH